MDQTYSHKTDIWIRFIKVEWTVLFVQRKQSTFSYFNPKCTANFVLSCGKSENLFWRMPIEWMHIWLTVLNCRNDADFYVDCMPVSPAAIGNVNDGVPANEMQI